MTNLFPTPCTLLPLCTDTSFPSLRVIAYAVYSILNELVCKTNLVYLFVNLLLVYV